ncbi:hypothetical protein AB0H42_00795 [Nocardia sp. NPDC050799]|uniref:effector-associated constant component EACC1 n=1 Tax=Nocardia sp. NPDC050799 TaxID=3154842 RepID=UPI0033C91188
MRNELRLSVAADDGEQVESLLRWLGQEPELRGLVDAVVRTPEKGEMGSWVDVATVTVGGGGVLSVLAVSLKTWLAQPRRSDVEITVKGSAGRSITVNAKRVDDVSALLQSVLDAQR